MKTSQNIIIELSEDCKITSYVVAETAFWDGSMDAVDAIIQSLQEGKTTGISHRYGSGYFIWTTLVVIWGYHFWDKNWGWKDHLRVENIGKALEFMLAVRERMNEIAASCNAYFEEVGHGTHGFFRTSADFNS